MQEQGTSYTLKLMAIFICFYTDSAIQLIVATLALGFQIYFVQFVAYMHEFSLANLLSTLC